MDRKVFVKRLMDHFVLAEDFVQSKMVTRMLLLKEDNTPIG